MGAAFLRGVSQFPPYGQRRGIRFRRKCASQGISEYIPYTRLRGRVLLYLVQSVCLSQRPEIILQIIDDCARRKSITTIGGDAGLSRE